MNVTVLDLLGSGQPCTVENTNLVSNTNLFTEDERSLIQEIFVKYQDVTTNCGPPGTQLVAVSKTNFVYQSRGNAITNERWVGQFQYTNNDAKEEIVFSGKAISAKYRSTSDNGYNAYIGWDGKGSMLRLMTVRAGTVSGVVAEFHDLHPQGVNWDYKDARFTNSILAEYRQCTNGLVFGKFFMWDVRSRLILAAEFKEPYDFEKHRVPWR